MWVVRVENDLYVRSAVGPRRPWFQDARSRGAGRIRVGGVVFDVSFAEPLANAHSDIDDADHAKYDRYGASIVGHVRGPVARFSTIRLLPK
jgi:hypothetical protein